MIIPGLPRVVQGPHQDTFSGSAKVTDSLNDSRDGAVGDCFGARFFCVLLPEDVSEHIAFSGGRFSDTPSRTDRG